MTDIKQHLPLILTALHPASAPDTKAHEIYCYGPTATFTQATTLAFQPMLQSFKFMT